MTSTTAKPTIVNGTWLTRQKFAALHYIVYGIIPEGVTLLVAPPKAGKSWLVLAIALARAAGGCVLGQQLAAGPVLYLALEDGHRRLQDRCRALLAPDEAIPANLHFIINMGNASVIETIRDWIAEHHSQNPLVIIDTFGRVKPPARASSSAYDHDYAVMADLKKLVDEEPGSAMIVVHHDRKAASDDFVDAVSGTHGIAGAADTTVVIRRPRTEDGAILCVTGRDVTEAEYAATFKAGNWTLAASNLADARRQATAMKVSAGLGDRSTRIVQLAADHPDGIRAKDVAEAEGISPQSAGVYLKRLADTGRMRTPQRGLYTHVESVESVVTDRLDSTDSTLSTPDTGHSDSTLVEDFVDPETGTTVASIEWVDRDAVTHVTGVTGLQGGCPVCATPLVFAAIPTARGPACRRCAPGIKAGTTCRDCGHPRDLVNDGRCNPCHGVASRAVSA